MTLAAALALIGMPVQAACWTDSEVAAAKVRDLDSMLMVSALRCRFESAALLKRYNAMVVRHRAGFTAANARLRGHFMSVAGAGPAADAALDRYITQVANRHGSATGAPSCASLAGIAQTALVQPATFAGLSSIASRAVFEPELPGGACTARLTYALN